MLIVKPKRTLVDWLLARHYDDALQSILHHVQQVFESDKRIDHVRWFTQQEYDSNKMQQGTKHRNL
ncbi:hypothetical protein Mal48_16270 [Thalassoglobus polymorphus]|uniref:Uncharacterized protein n=1 Tax=Thalassoglobus polymorphus TaxID=2527994 RepID=A0A517QL93_9PLAN|nr:hypothetical protein Mal48_16270 [Thalassoglobus polymorphus]